MTLCYRVQRCGNNRRVSWWKGNVSHSIVLAPDAAYDALLAELDRLGGMRVQ